jgi:hypothetical protein
MFGAIHACVLLTSNAFWELKSIYVLILQRVLILHDFCEKHVVIFFA